jgi:hypothetical protein
MQEPKDVAKDTIIVPATPNLPAPPAEADDAAKIEKEKENELEIAIQEVPETGSCGGY